MDATCCDRVVLLQLLSQAETFLPTDKKYDNVSVTRQITRSKQQQDKHDVIDHLQLMDSFEGVGGIGEHA